MTKPKCWSCPQRSPLPLVEGKCPPEYDPEKKEWYYPEPNWDYKDPEIYETETYKVEDKEEYYGYPTICKACGTEFQAYQGAEKIRNFCPGCGRKLD